MRSLSCRMLVVFGLSMVAAVFAAAGQRAGDGAAPGPEALRKSLEALAARLDGEVGIGVRDLRNGATVLVGGGKAYPMQSVYKFPIAAALLEQADQGRLSLSRTLRLGEEDFTAGWSPLADRIRRQGPREETVEAVLRRMVSESDNMACDVLLGLIGGPPAVQACLGGHGLAGIRVDRCERDLQTQALGLVWDPSFRNPEVLRAAANKRTAAEQRRALQAYLSDARDTASPEGMLDLLQALHEGKTLSGPSRALLLDAMLQTATGPGRLKAGLPAGWKLAHKTGSSGTERGVAAATNDVGLAYGPNGEVVALAVFVKASAKSQAERERLIADVARTALAALARRP